MLKRTGICVAVILFSATLFSVPLVIKYHVYRPREIKATNGDTVLVSDRISSVWCEAEIVSHGKPFAAYSYKSPHVNISYAIPSHASRRLLLRSKEFEYWGFHLLRGSTVSLYGCSKLPGAAATLIKGRGSLNRCLSENIDSFQKMEDSSEEGESSQSESDAETSSISSSQGVFSNETYQPHTCYGALEHAKFDFNTSCRHSKSSSDFQFEHVIAKSDVYYLLFAGNPYLEIVPTDIRVRLELSRTYHVHDSATAKCENSTECTMSVSFASSQKIFVELPNRNGSWSQETITASCSPRKVLFFLFYLTFAVAIFICAFL